MDYIGNKCPVCEQYFHSDDDIVVCPDCGTPHHRACYESLNHCANQELHQEGYDFSKDEKKNENADAAICHSCGKENDKYQFFCKYCGAPLQPEERKQSTANNAQNAQGPEQHSAALWAELLLPLRSSIPWAAFRLKRISATM